jgi:hypothetical protein
MKTFQIFVQQQLLLNWRKPVLIVQIKVNEKILRLIFINECKVQQVLTFAISCIEAVFENLIFYYYNFWFNLFNSIHWNLNFDWIPFNEKETNSFLFKSQKKIYLKIFRIFLNFDKEVFHSYYG